MPPKNKKSKSGKDSSASGNSSIKTKTLAHYFSKATSKPSTSAPQLSQPKSTTPVTTTGAGSSKDKPSEIPDKTKGKKNKKEKENAPLSNDILDLTMEEDEPTAVQINAEDILGLTLVDDDDVMEVEEASKPSHLSKNTDILPIQSEANIVSLSDLLELSHPLKPSDIVPTPDISRAPSPMPPQAISEDDEAAFMSRLLQGLDETASSGSTSTASTTSTSLPSFPSISTISTAPTSRTPSIQSITSTTSFLEPTVPPAEPSGSLTNDADMVDFLAGSEEWDLDDFALTPVKPKGKLPLRNLTSPMCSARSKGKQRELETVNALDGGLRKALLQFNHDEDQRDLAQQPCTRCIVDASEPEYDSALAKWRKVIVL